MQPPNPGPVRHTPGIRPGDAPVRTFRPKEARRNRRSKVPLLRTSYDQLLFSQQTSQLGSSAVDSRFYGAFGDAQNVGDLPILQLLQVPQNNRFPQVRRQFLQGQLQDLAGLASGQL